MLPGENFDESRLVKPGEWDEEVDDDAVLKNLQARMDADLQGIRQGLEPPQQSVRETHMEVAWSDGTSEDRDFSSLLGKVVKLDGLKGRPELNGCIGRVWSWNAHTGRAGVRLEGEQEPRVGTLAVRPINLIEVQAAMESGPAVDLPARAPSGEAVCGSAAEAEGPSQSMSAEQEDPSHSIAEPDDVEPERLAAFYARATNASATMTRETHKLHEKHRALCQAVGEGTVKQWYDEHQAEVDEQQRRAGTSDVSEPLTFDG